MICVPSFTLIENFLTDECRADSRGAAADKSGVMGAGNLVR